ncbi:amidohydrolase [Pseudoxanthomonas sp. UTMC 1351]|uniref:amidohydrolase n=1 Tax=Pseudoxanthomonas sp. UTMC 1351 TaxID=2695853 RepID=UPI0034CFC091
MIVDAHQHFWRPDRGDYGWLRPADGVLYRDYLPQDLAPLIATHDVQATVLVQAAPTEAETRYLLDLAAQNDFVAGVVGWVDMEAPNAPGRIADLVAYGDGKLKGLRPMVQDIADPQWLLKPVLDAAFEAMIDHRLVFDALVLPHQLPTLQARLLRHPKLRAVLDHAGKPDIAGEEFPGWAGDIAQLARELPLLHCKLSGLLTQAGDGAGADELAPYVAHLFEHFGPKRLMWGSDWPVLNLKSDYGLWLEIARTLVRRHAPGHEQNILGATAIGFYALDKKEETV